MIIFNSTNKHTICFTKKLGLNKNQELDSKAQTQDIQSVKSLEIRNLFHIRRIMLLAHKYPIKLHSH
jgi:hypothetical protein